MDYTQTHSVNLSTADCNKIVKDSLNYNLAGVTKTETVPNVFEYLDISATAGSFFHPRKPQKLTIKLEPIDDNATSVTIKTEPRQPVSDYEYNDWNKELIQLGNTVWQNFLTAARNKLGELALAVNNIEPFDEPKKREEHTEQTTEAATVSQSAQPTSPELQPIQSNADIAVSTTAQAENTKINPKTWWIIGGIVAAVIIFIISVSGGGLSKFSGTYYSPLNGKIIINKNQIIWNGTEEKNFTTHDDEITINTSSGYVYLKYFSSAKCLCPYTDNTRIKITDSELLSIAQTGNGYFDYQERDYDNKSSLYLIEIYRSDGTYSYINSKTNEIYAGTYTYHNGLLRVVSNGSTKVQMYLSNDGYIYPLAFLKQ